MKRHALLLAPFCLLAIAFSCTNLNLNGSNFKLSGSVNNTGLDDSMFRFNGTLNRTDGLPVTPTPPPPQIDTTQVYEATVFAGTSNTSSSSIDGQGTNATFNDAYGMITDSNNNIYVADGNKIRKITPDGYVSTFAGNNAWGDVYNPQAGDGQGTDAKFSNATSLDIDLSGNIYVGQNRAVRKITPDGYVSTLYNGIPIWWWTNGVAVDKVFTDNNQNVYFSSYNDVYQVNQFGQASQITNHTENWYPSGILMDNNGTLFVADDGQNEVQAFKKGYYSGTPIRLAGYFAYRTNQYSIFDGSMYYSTVSSLYALNFDKQNNIIFSDLNRIRRISYNLNNLSATTTTLTITTKDMSLKNYILGLSLNNIELISSVKGITADSIGNIYISEPSRIIKLTPKNISVKNPKDSIRYNSSLFASDIHYFNQYNHSHHLYDIAIDKNNNNLFISSFVTGIYKLNLSENNIPIEFGSDDEEFRNENLFFDYSSSFGLKIPTSFIVESDSSLIGSSGSDTIKISNLGEFSLLNTNSDSYSSFGFAKDSQGNIYTSSYDRHVIYKNNQVFAGTKGVCDYQNGSTLSSKFCKPAGLAFDSNDNLYVADSANHSIRKITPDGNVTTIAGDGLQGFSDGQGTNAKFYSPMDLVLDSLNNIYVSDTGNNRIRKINSNKDVWTISGDGSFGQGAGLNQPRGIDLDSSGNIYVSNSGSGTITKLSKQ